MPDIHFECPKCKQTLDAPEELATQLIECPTCKATIEVPVRSRHKEPPKPAAAPARAPQIKPPEVGKPGIKPAAMNTTNLLLAGILGALIFIGIHKPSPIVLPPAAASLKWEYKVEACDDDSTEMREYVRTHPDPDSSPLDFQNEFSLLKVKPSGSDYSTDWELCAWFLEPKAHPTLILIFKRQLS